MATALERTGGVTLIVNGLVDGLGGFGPFVLTEWVAESWNPTISENPIPVFSFGGSPCPQVTFLWTVPTRMSDFRQPLALV